MVHRGDPHPAVANLVWKSLVSDRNQVLRSCAANHRRSVESESPGRAYDLGNYLLGSREELRRSKTGHSKLRGLATHRPLQIQLQQPR